MMNADKTTTLNLNPNPAISGISDDFNTTLVFTEAQLRASFVSNEEEDRNGYREAIRMVREYWSNLRAQQGNFLVRPMVGSILETLKLPLGFEYLEPSGKGVCEVDDVARCLVAALGPVFTAEAGGPRINPEDERLATLDAALTMLEAVIV